MKRYGIAGTVILVAGIGLYLNCDQKHEETKSKQSAPGEKVGYQPEVPQNKTPASSTTAKRSEERRTKKTIPNKTTNKSVPQNSYNPYYSIQPTSPGLENTLDDEEEEEQWYNLPPEKRNFKTLAEIEPYLNAAINARDYKVAESYLTNFQKITSPEDYERLKKGLLYVIASDYNGYLTDILEHCDQYDSDSVLRKVLWMNLFTNNHPEVFPIADPFTKNSLDIAALFKKGSLALDATEYCPEKRIHE